MNTDKIILTTAQILDAHATHGDDFVVVNFESCRKHKNFAQYIDIDIKLANGVISSVRYWKLSNQGIVVGARIRKPEERKYETIRMGVALKDEQGVVNENIKALQLLCAAFEAKMKQFKMEDVVTDEESLSVKQKDGTFRPFHLISTKIKTPMQGNAKNKDGQTVQLDVPYFWISIPKKKAYEMKDQKPSTHFDDKYYIDECGQTDYKRPVMTYEFSPSFSNSEDFYHHPRSGKKVYKRLGQVDGDEISLNNSNVQDYLTKGSALLGNLKFELAVSGRQCKLEVALYGNFYVKVAEVSEGGQSIDEDDLDCFNNKYAGLSVGSAAVCDEEEMPPPYED
jgi:hypothetical protein